MKTNSYDETGKSFEDEYSEADIEFLLLFINKTNITYIPTSKTTIHNNIKFFTEEK